MFAEYCQRYITKGLNRVKAQAIAPGTKEPRLMIRPTLDLLPASLYTSTKTSDHPDYT